jgi:hypothetical protein
MCILMKSLGMPAGLDHRYGVRCESSLCSSGRGARVQVTRRIRCSVRGRQRRRHELPGGHGLNDDRRRHMRARGGRRRKTVRRECVLRFNSGWLRVVFG